MNIVTEKEINGRLIDGINTILQFDDESFADVITHLSAPANKIGYFNCIIFWYTTDKCECPNNPIQVGIEQDLYNNNKSFKRGYYGGHIYKRYEIMKEIDRLKELIQDENSPKFQRCQGLLQCCDENALRKHYLTKTIPELVDQAFAILSNKKSLQSFLNSNADKENVIKIILDIFNERVCKFDYFYIKKEATWIDHYLTICNQVNIEYFAPAYKNTGNLGILETIIDFQNEEWELNPELRETILAHMPEDFTPEQKALYIYCQLVKLFNFNQCYSFRNKTDVQEDFSGQFDKSRMESLTIDSEILCFDITRIFSKLASEIEGVTPVIVRQQGTADKKNALNNQNLRKYSEGHYRTGFYTKDVSVALEPVNMQENGRNDLYNAKAGLQLGGIKIVSDRKGLVRQALEVVQPLVFGANLKTTEQHMAELHEAVKPNVTKGTALLLQSLIEALKQNNLEGNEAILALLAIEKAGFLPCSLEYSFIGEKIEKDGIQTRQRKVIITDTYNKCLYLFDTSLLTISDVTMEEVQRGLITESFIYEDEKRRPINIEGGKTI